MDEAKVFKKWVVKKVLPSIDRTGTFSLTDDNVKGSGNMFLYKNILEGQEKVEYDKNHAAKN